MKNNKQYNDIIQKILNGNDGKTDGEIQITEDKINKMKHELMNKKRHLEIDKYYEKKYIKQTNIIQNLIVILFVMLCISFLFKLYIINENVFIVLIGILLAILIIYLIYEMIDIFMRDNRDFDQYKYNTMPSVSTLKKNNANIPIELKADIPDYCFLEDTQLEIIDE